MASQIDGELTDGLVDEIGKGAHYKETNKTGFLLIPQPKVDLKGIKDLNTNSKIINLIVRRCRISL